MRRTLHLLVSFFALVSTSVVLAVGGAGAASSATLTVGSRAGFAPGGGILWESDADLAKDLDAMAATGAHWVRFDFDWNSVENTKGNFNWYATDRAVHAAQARGLQVLALPAYTPPWARAAGTSDKTPPSNPADFANFVRAAVQRYSGQGVKHWEIWNEPNIPNFWASGPNAAAYASLLKAAGDAVHLVDPSATVLSAGMSPATDSTNSISPLTFLTRIYAAGVQSSFDAVAIHPYSYPALPMDPSTASWNTFYRMPQLHDLMVAHGDGAKKIWGTEFGAPTGTNAVAVSETKQAQVAHDGYDAITKWSWAGPLFWYSHRDAGTNPLDVEQNFGLIRQNFTPKPALATFTAAMATPIAGTGVGTLPVVPPAPPAPTGPSTSGLVLDGWGGLHPFGDEAAPTTGAYWKGWDIARGMAMLPDGSGGLVLDGWGGLHPFTTGTAAAPAPTHTAYWKGWDIARSIALLPDGTGGYVLDGWGGLHPFAIGSNPLPPDVSGLPYWKGWAIARSVTILPDGTGGYVLDGWGGVHPFAIGHNKAPAGFDTGAYWKGWDIARGLTLLADGSGGFVLDGWGGLHGFGLNGQPAPAMPSSAYWGGWDIARAIVAHTQG
ncbi:MAG: polysaccharide biosynthesis protein PslG [Actinomycetota bacterium]|jgi:hypothetical protein|nr:polysaccharide biosynthesis protein PslG [Actinomycetota bacterium]